jgi:hypothetical protein
MARSSSGRSVARAAATGGGATYRGQMPINWYAALVVIVLIGIGSVALAKFHYNQSAAAVEPTTNTTWHAALAFDICGTMEPALAASSASATATTGLTSSGQGVLQIHPKDSSESGNNATLGKFAQGFSGMTITNNIVKYPSSSSLAYKDGQKCGTGTPDAGKVGTVQARWWVQSTKGNETTLVGGVTTKSPADLKFQNRQVITVGFGPADAPLPKPPSSTILALTQTVAGAGPVATTTTAPATASTTVPSTTTTLPASATTTTRPPAATTTTAPSSTTTTKPSATTSTTK